MNYTGVKRVVHVPKYFQQWNYFFDESFSKQHYGQLFHNILPLYGHFSTAGQNLTPADETADIFIMKRNIYCKLHYMYKHYYYLWKKSVFTVPDYRVNIYWSRSLDQYSLFPIIRSIFTGQDHQVNIIYWSRSFRMIKERLFSSKDILMIIFIFAYTKKSVTHQTIQSNRMRSLILWSDEMQLTLILLGHNPLTAP